MDQQRTDSTDKSRAPSHRYQQNEWHPNDSPAANSNPPLKGCGKDSAYQPQTERTFYVLTRDDENVFPLLDLGKSWHWDRTEVIDRTRTGQLLGRHPAPPPIVVYWWD